MPATKITEKRMGMPEIRMKAKALGLIPGKMKKADLIHAIQVAEGCMHVLVNPAVIAHMLIAALWQTASKLNCKFCLFNF